MTERFDSSARRCQGTVKGALLPADAVATTGGNVMLPYGVGADGRLVHVSKVLSGLACCCRCPACNGKLVAKHGEVRVAHFAHYVDTACSAAFETMLHRLAKQVICDRQEVTLPKAYADLGATIEVVQPSEVLRPDEVVIEARLNPIRPDILARAGNRELLIEIAVTHFCEPEKIALLAERRWEAIEIDLSKLSRNPEEAALEDAIVYNAPRRWLWNRAASEVEATHRERVARQLADSAARAAQLINDRVALLRAAATRPSRNRDEVSRIEHRHIPDEPLWGASHLAAAQAARLMANLRKIDKAGIENLVGLNYAGNACFAVLPELWQAAVLADLLWPGHDTTSVVPSIILKSLEDQGCLWPEFILPEDGNPYLGQVGWNSIRQRAPDFCFPVEAVTTYLDHLKVAGVLHREKDASLQVVDDWATAIYGRVEAAFAPERRRQEIEWEARRVLSAVFNPQPLATIIEPTLGWADGFDVFAWMQAPLDGGASPEEIARAGGPAFGTLLVRLRQLTILKDQEVDVPDGPLLGLPVESALADHRRQVAQNRQALPSPQGDWNPASEAERKTERAHKDAIQPKAEAAHRLESLQRLSLDGLGGVRSREWLSAPQEALGGKSISETGGWMSSAQEVTLRRYIKAESARLDAVSATVRTEAALRETLERHAMSVLRTKEKVEVWLNCANPALGGRRPKDLCLEPGGMERCVALLRPPARGRRRL